MKSSTLLLFFVFLFSVLIVFPQVNVQAAEKGVSTQLPLPRFASLSKAEAHVRTGPSQDYPIKWTYQRKGLPVEIIKEYDAWRKIRDHEGAEGWVHKIMLSGKRTVMVTKGEPLEAWDDEDHEQLAARIDENVIGLIDVCTQADCLVRFSSIKAWVQKKRLWGIYPSEILN